jgi:uncharacterized membrane protein
MPRTTVATAQIDKRIDQWMGILLRSGVILAAVLVFVGGILYLARNAAPPFDYRVFRGEPQNLRGVSGILAEAKTFHAPGLIQLGLLILIATPIARVAFSVFAFLYERDWKYVGFTLIVFGLLLYSLVGH